MYAGVFIFNSHLNVERKKSKQQFISYALIVNTARLTASTPRYNIPLDNQQFIIGYTVLVQNERQSANNTRFCHPETLT